MATRSKRARRLLHLVFRIQKGKCFYCQKECWLPECGDPLTVRKPDKDMASRDHIIPRSMGGTNSNGNVVMACVGCNNKKKNNIPHGTIHEIKDKIRRGIPVQMEEM